MRTLILSLISVGFLAHLAVAGDAPVGDLTGDCRVDLQDAAVFCAQWLDEGYCPGPNCGDFDDENGVDGGDFAVLAESWGDECWPLIISEFMASNDGILDDGDGNSSDWIEIYNRTSTEVSLDDWALRSDVNDWAFPDGLSVPAGCFLTVFASGKQTQDYVDSLGYLHTDFTLEKDGQYLGLVPPEGGGPIHAYEPNFALQYEDVSYGVQMSSDEEVLVGDGAALRYLVPDDGSVDATWFTTGFSDTLWDSGSTGVGYDDFARASRNTTSYLDMIDSNVLDEMRGSHPGIYTRIWFSVDVNELAVFNQLLLRMKYDDGFAAYLNNVEVARSNAPNTPAWNSVASELRRDNEALVFETYDLTSQINLLQAGTNLLAIHGMNWSVDSSDLLIYPQLVGATVTEDTTEVGFMPEPTPAATNTETYDDLVADITIYPDGGVFEDPCSFDVTVSQSVTPGSVLSYTLDGSTPSMTNGFTYSGPINVSGTTVLRAGAFKAGLAPSTIVTRSYIYVDEVDEQGDDQSAKGFPSTWETKDGFVRDADYEVDPDVVTDPAYSDEFIDDLKSIPTLSLVTDLNNLFDSQTGIYANPVRGGSNWERPVSVEYIDPNGGEGFQINAAIRILGFLSRLPELNPKHSMRLLFKGKYGPKKLKFPLFKNTDVARFDTVTLRNQFNWNWLDADNFTRGQYLRDTFAQDTMRDMGHLSPDSIFVHLYLNGLYWGLYQVSERPDESFLAEHLGGNKDDYDVYLGEVEDEGYSDSIATAYGPVLRSGQRDTWDAMMGLLDGHNYDNPLNQTEYETLEQYLNMPEFVDFMIFNAYIVNWDFAFHNWYAGCRRGLPGQPPETKWEFYVWDSEIGMLLSFFEFCGPYGSTQDMGPGRIHNCLMKNEQYKRLFGDRIHKRFFNDGAMTAQNNIDRYLSRANTIEGPVVGESARWGDWLVDQNPGGGYYLLTRDDHWIGERDRLLGNDWFATRSGTLVQHYRDKDLYPNVDAPQFSQHGGEVSAGFSVTITGPGGTTIYYTTDGSEPIDNGTVISSGSSVAVNHSMSLRARAHESGPDEWSALNEAVFVIDTVKDELRITEIMYHPLDTNDPNDANEEFIEVTNIGSGTLNLNLASFTEGIYFTFGYLELAPGEYVVVAKDLNAFEAEHGEGLNVAGEYIGSLANAGERVRLEDAIGQTILDFEYSDSWRDITDGDGFSLTIIDANNPEPNSWGQKDSWRASSFVGGSPGAGDEGLLPDPGSIVINEVLAHSHAAAPDWIELYNATGEPVNIGGWFLSDDDSNDANRMKYEIAADTVIGADGYLVFYEDVNFGDQNDAGCDVPFALSENGEEVVLSSAQGGVLTGYREVEDFGASDTNVAFGRYYKQSTGNFNFVAMSENTPWLPNAYPKVGPIVINEIMYHPDWPQGGAYEDEEYEYVELHNIGEESVALYDYVEGAPWKFTDGIEFTFPTAPVAEIAAGEYLLVVKNPAAFAEQYPSVPSAIVLGPYDGQLQNSGETLEIGKPGDVDLVTSERYYIRVDRVKYSDGSHPENCPGGVDLWPVEADGDGYSLTRTDPNLYGNDPNNWTAEEPSPGP